MNLRRRALLMDPHLAAAAMGLPDDGSDSDPAGGGGTPPTDPPEDGQDDSKLGDGGKAALAAERRRANEAEKARKAAEAELQKLKDQGLSEQERKDREAKDAVARAEAAEARALRLEVAAEKGLDLKLAGRLQGATREELEADADDLKALLPGTAPGDSGDGKVRRLNPDRGQGSKPQTPKGGYEAGVARAKARYSTPTTGGDAA